MSTSEALAYAFLAELRRFVGETPLTTRITPMQWIALAKELGLSDSARGEVVTFLRTKGYVSYKPETTEIMALSPSGIEMADLQIRKRPKVSDVFPDTLEGIYAELDYWELHLNDGYPGSIYWDQVQARIEGLRHRENRLRPLISITNNAIGPNSRINQCSVDQSVNSVNRDAESRSVNRAFESNLKEPGFRDESETTPASASNRATTALPDQRVTIREESAAEILANLKGIGPSRQFHEIVEELYLGRWTREPGWRVAVHDLPSKLPGGRWHCIFAEVGSGTAVCATTAQDVSTLRAGDSVTVSGRISDVCPLL